MCRLGFSVDLTLVSNCLLQLRVETDHKVVFYQNAENDLPVKGLSVQSVVKAGIEK